MPYNNIIRMEEMPVKLDLLLECSWEVCNKIGGIYTVLSTKAKTLQQLYKGSLIFIGPDVWSAENPSPYFTESTPAPLKSWKQSLELPMGVTVRVGRWNVPGKPMAVLVKFDGVYPHLNEIYGRMWHLYGVDSLHAYGDYNEGCAFGIASALVMESLAKHLAPGRDANVIAHFNEWTTGMGELYLKMVMPSVATIFTTHATSIGRSICGKNKPLYDYLRAYNGDQMAHELNMESKHSLEKAAAHQADCFTTVSEITAAECEQLLERRPEEVTPNGFERNFVPSGAKYSQARADARRRLVEVANALAGRRFDVNQTFIVGTSGRCEYRNKGIDLYIDSMQRLAAEHPSKDVLAYIMVPAWVKEPRADLLQSMSGRGNHSLWHPYITHWINNPGEDPIESRLGQVNIPDNVTLIYVPCYLDGRDGIFNRTYYDLLVGFDATVFPSYYEPWGYTPLESVAFGIPTITTSLSGFGQWILSNYDNSFDRSGVNVVARGDSNYDNVVGSIARALRYLINIDSDEMHIISKAAMRTARAADWSNFIAYYERAFELALERAKQRNTTH